MNVHVIHVLMKCVLCSTCMCVHVYVLYVLYVCVLLKCGGDYKVDVLILFVGSQYSSEY